MWEIIDDNGTIHSGSEEEMTHAFAVMSSPELYSTDDINKWEYEWSGDLRLIEVHAIAK